MGCIVLGGLPESCRMCWAQGHLTWTTPSKWGEILSAHPFRSYFGEKTHWEHMVKHTFHGHTKTHGSGLFLF